MLDKRKSSILVIAAFVALIASSHAQGSTRRADADPNYIATQVGATVNLLCLFPSPIISCRFVIPGEPDIKLNPSWKRNDNFKYYGNGLESGQCGVTILNVREAYHGNASCILDPNDGQADATGNIEIVIARAPQLPQIELQNQDRLEAGDSIDATCSSLDGRPVANLSWYLNDQPLGPGSVEIRDTEDSSKGPVYSAVHSRLRYVLKPEDHTKNLICRAAHVGYPEGFSDTSVQLSVNFRPVPQGEIFVSGLEIGSSANIGPITILANPRPSLKWTVDGTVINQGEQTQRFVASEPVQIGVGAWNASLTVIELTLQDTTRTYKLRANNAFGTTDYQIRVGGSQDNAGSGLGIVSIVAISIIALFVLIVVALIVVAKVTKRWCFAGDSMHPNGPDSEAQIAPEDDKNHEHYEQHEKSTDEEPETGAGDAVTTTNGKAKGNTSV